MARIIIEFPRPKSSRPKPLPYLYEAECKALVGRYFILDDKIGHVIEARKDRDSHTWEVLFREVSVGEREAWNPATRKWDIKYIGIYDQEIFEAASFKTHRAFNSAQEITADDYWHFRNIYYKSAAKIVSDAISAIKKNK